MSCSHRPAIGMTFSVVTSDLEVESDDHGRSCICCNQVSKPTASTINSRVVCSMSDGKPTNEVLHSHVTHTLTGNGPFILDFESGMVHGDAGTSFPPAGAAVGPDLQNARASTTINRPMYANRKRRFAEIRRGAVELGAGPSRTFSETIAPPPSSSRRLSGSARGPPTETNVSNRHHICAIVAGMPRPDFYDATCEQRHATPRLLRRQSCKDSRMLQTVKKKVYWCSFARRMEN